MCWASPPTQKFQDKTCFIMRIRGPPPFLISINLGHFNPGFCAISLRQRLLPGVAFSSRLTRLPISTARGDWFKTDPGRWAYPGFSPAPH
jgi:hypothetical protein